MLVQLVCLDRRYQRMNCYNIREIQTILKSKYSPNTDESADVRFGLNDTIIGLRYQLGDLNFLDTSVFTYYKNALLTHPRYRAMHEFLHKPIVEFDSVKLFMSKCSLMFSVLHMMYEDESLDIRHLFGATNVTTAAGPTSLVTQFLPHVNTASIFNNTNFSTYNTGLNAKLFFYSFSPNHTLEKILTLSAPFGTGILQPLMFSLKSLVLS